MATAAVPKTRIGGGSFLIEDRTPDEVFTPEDLSEEQVMIEMREAIGDKFTRIRVADVPATAAETGSPTRISRSRFTISLSTADPSAKSVSF